MYGRKERSKMEREVEIIGQVEGLLRFRRDPLNLSELEIF